MSKRSELLFSEEEMRQFYAAPSKVRNRAERKRQTKYRLITSVNMNTIYKPDHITNTDISIVRDKN